MAGPGHHRLRGSSALDPSSLSPDVDFNFASGQYSQPGVPACVSAATCITTARASAGYADDTSGNWINFGSNVARVTDKGLLVEEARTNGIRNNSMQGAVAGSPGTLPTNWTVNDAGFGVGVTRTISTGTQNGIDYVEFNYTGTPNATGSLQLRNDPITQITAASGQTWTYSAFVSNPSAVGATNIRLALLGVNGVGVQQEATTGATFVSDTAFSRRTLTFALANAATVAVSGDVRVSFTSGVPVNFTIRIGWPQLELGAFATSPIRTTTIAATRAADAITATTAPAFGSACTAFAQAKPTSPNSNSLVQFLVALSDGTVNNRLRISRTATVGNVAGDITVGAVTQTAPSFPPGSWAQNTSSKAAFAATANSAALSFAGSAPTTASPAFPDGLLTSVAIGRNVGLSQFWGGYVERIAIWPTTRLSDSNLQQITQ